MNTNEAAAVLFSPVFAYLGSHTSVYQEQPDHLNFHVSNSVGKIHGDYDVTTSGNDRLAHIHGNHFGDKVDIVTVQHGFQDENGKVDLRVKTAIQFGSPGLGAFPYGVEGIIRGHGIISMPFLIPERELWNFLDPGLNYRDIEKLVQEEWSMGLATKAGSALELLALMSVGAAAPKEALLCRAGILDGTTFKMTVAHVSQCGLLGTYDTLGFGGALGWAKDPRDEINLRTLKFTTLLGDTEIREECFAHR